MEKATTESYEIVWYDRARLQIRLEEAEKVFSQITDLLSPIYVKGKDENGDDLYHSHYEALNAIYKMTCEYAVKYLEADNGNKE